MASPSSCFSIRLCNEAVHGNCPCTVLGPGYGTTSFVRPAGHIGTGTNGENRRVNGRRCGAVQTCKYSNTANTRLTVCDIGALMLSASYAGTVQRGHHHHHHHHHHHSQHHQRHHHHRQHQHHQHRWHDHHQHHQHHQHHHRNRHHRHRIIYSRCCFGQMCSCFWARRRKSHPKP